MSNKMEFDPNKIEFAESGEPSQFNQSESVAAPKKSVKKAPKAEQTEKPLDILADEETLNDIAPTENTAVQEAQPEPVEEPEAVAEPEVVTEPESSSESEVVAEPEPDTVAEDINLASITAETEEKTEVTEKAAEKPAEKAEKDEKAETPAEAKKENLGKRFLKFFIPWKGDPAREVFRKSIFLVALVVFIGAFSYLAVYLNNRLTYETVKNRTEDMVDETNSTAGEDGILNKYRALYNANNDFIGWITIPNTNVDGAVYQTLDNSYYIDHNGEKKKSAYGAYFADYKCTISENENSQNITLYGHHMRDQTMFAQIRKYKNISFYKENPTLTFSTLYEENTYKVFAAFITNAAPADDNGYFFDFAVQGFVNQSDFLSWIEQVRRRSLINTSVDVVEGDDILTLSTCTYELGTSKDMRFVVMARKVRDGESETVNVTDVSQNSKPLYPQAWYDRFGSKKPTFDDGLYTWGETTVQESSVVEYVQLPDPSSEQSSSTPSIPSFQNPLINRPSSESPTTSYDKYESGLYNCSKFGEMCEYWMYDPSLWGYQTSSAPSSNATGENNGYNY